MLGTLGWCLDGTVFKMLYRESFNIALVSRARVVIILLTQDYSMYVFTGTRTS